MGSEAIKLELIEWLTKLEDEETIQFLKIFKDSKEEHSDWWDDLTDEQKLGIQRGLNDNDQGKIFPHDEVKRKLGL